MDVPRWSVHDDGRWSFSQRNLFEDLRYPSPFEIERLVAAGDFKALNKLLAGVGARRSGSDKTAPKLVFADARAMMTSNRRHERLICGIGSYRSVDAGNARRLRQVGPSRHEPNGEGEYPMHADSVRPQGDGGC